MCCGFADPGVWNTRILMTDSDGDWQGHSIDPGARRARRAEQARRARRRRLIGAAAVVVVLVAAGAAVAALMAGGGGGDTTAAVATTGSASASTSPASTSVPATATAPASAVSSGDAPTAEEQAAAVARVRKAGLPLYRTPGKGGGIVALTFDDGPGPYTQKTVATLTQYGMRATFFLCGKSVVRYPDDPAIEATVAAMGDHSWNHPVLPALPVAEMKSEISRTQAIVAKTSGATVQVFRSPYGARNAAVDAAAESGGMIQVLWSIDSGDSAGVGWEDMLRNLKATLKPGDIVLFHENRGQTQKVINRLLPWMKKHGLRSVSVPELLAMDPPSEAFLRHEAGRYIAAR